MSSSSMYGNTYGLSPQFLESLGIDGPLHTRVFVANVSSVSHEKKLTLFLWKTKVPSSYSILFSRFCERARELEGF